MNHRILVPVLVLAAFGFGFWQLHTAAPPPERPPEPPKSDDFAPKGYVCHRARTPLKIDGRLDDPAWDDAAWTDDFVDIEGDARPRPRYRTRVKMLWDDHALYIAAQLEEPNVWATLTEHDSVIFHDNDFEVFLDPDGDSHLYGELEINALGTTWDLLLTRPYRDGGRAVNAWEITGLKTGVHIDGTRNDPTDIDHGWSVEICWPWKGASELTRRIVPPRDGDQWRINFSRVQWQHEVVAGKYRKIKDRAEDNWVWSPQWVIDMHRPERWGYLQFSAAAPGTAAFRPDPEWPARRLLHRVYYAQMEYRKSTGSWAKKLEELALADLAKSPLGTLRLETTASGFEANLPAAAGAGRTCRINSEGRVWSD